MIEPPSDPQTPSMLQNGGLAVAVLTSFAAVAQVTKAFLARRKGRPVTMDEAARVAVQQLINNRFIDTLVDARLQRLFDQGKEHEENTNSRFVAMENRVDARFESIEGRMDEESRKRMTDRGLILRAVQELRQDLGK